MVCESLYIFNRSQGLIWMTIMSVVKKKCNIGEGAVNMAEVDDLGFAEKMKE